MKRASSHFSAEDRRRITSAVVAAEGMSDAEYVPVVATASGRYDRAEDIVGLWLGGAGAMAVWVLLPEAEGTGSWGMVPGWLGAVLIGATLVAGFIAGVVIASRVAWLRKLFTPRGQMREEVEEAAHRVFFDLRVHHTREAVGVLVYVSLFERMASVVADEAVIDALREPGQDDAAVLQSAVDALTADLGGGDVSRALVARIDSLAVRISTQLPATSSDPNEIDDALVTID